MSAVGGTGSTRLVLRALRQQADKEARIVQHADELLAALRTVRTYLRRKNFDSGDRAAYVAIIDAALHNATGSEA